MWPEGTCRDTPFESIRPALGRTDLVRGADWRRRIAHTARVHMEHFVQARLTGIKSSPEKSGDTTGIYLLRIGRLGSIS